MIGTVVEQWHRYVRGDLPSGLDALLADDVVFYSPIVFTPQEGKAITRRYLEAAATTLMVDDPSDEQRSGGGFRYTKQVIAGDTAVLEFETTLRGRYVNGVDIIRCDEHDRIVEFRVMIRPLQAVNLFHEQMRATLDAMASEEERTG